MRTLGLFFGDESFTFTVTSAVPQVVQKTRTTPASRMWRRMWSKRGSYWASHFRFADTVARRQGKQAADWAFSHILRPFD